MMQEKLQHLKILAELKFVKGDGFNYLRLDLEIYLQLLSIMESIITQEDTIMRKYNSAHERLIAILGFLTSVR